MELITQTEWAKRHGFSRQYANKLVKKGIIRLHDGKINPEEADKALLASSDPLQTPKRKGGEKNNVTKLSIVKTKKPPTTTQTTLSDDELQGKHDLSQKLLEARLKSETEKGKILEAKAQTEIGKLVDAEEVRKAVFDIARVARDSILNVPDRISSTLTSITDEKEMHDVLTKELRVALESLNKDINI